MNTNEELEENTAATVENTKATEAAGGGGITKTTAYVCGVLIAATCFISFINNEFANQQAGMILSGITGGIFGVAVGKRI